MSKTYDMLQEAIKSAMKEGRYLVRDTLRMVVSDVKNKTVNAGKEITEDVVVSSLKRFAKQIEDSIESAKAAGRNDLVDKANSELAVVSQFLPRMMTKEQMISLCEDLYANLPGVTFGWLMKNLPENCDKKYCAQVLQRLFKAR